MLFANLRASAWKYACLACAVLAVAVLAYCLFLRAGVSNARLRADAAEVRAQAAEGQVRALKDAAKRDSVARDATDVARKAADARQPIQEARAAKVKGYAETAAATCVADPRIVRELGEGTDRVLGAAGRLRGDGRPEGAAAGAADH